ncbi:hypothetical protein ACFSKM_01455 [Ancylobacter dichloromethanicus]
MSYADLQQATADTATYADIWKDAIEDNNRAYLARGDTRYASANAPATEAHFVIWSARKAVVLSILNTATGCTLKEVQASARATIKLCPLRIAIYEGIQVRTLDGGAPASSNSRRPRRAHPWTSPEPSPTLPMMSRRRR